MVSNKTLGKIAVYIAIGGISSVVLMRRKIQNDIRETECFRKSLKLFRCTPGVVNLLGEPIKERGFDLTDTTKNFIDEKRCHFEISVKGPKTRGTMYTWGEKLENNEWNIKRIELELKNEPNRRYLVKKE